MSFTFLIEYGYNRLHLAKTNLGNPAAATTATRTPADFENTQDGFNEARKITGEACWKRDNDKFDLLMLYCYFSKAFLWAQLLPLLTTVLKTRYIVGKEHSSEKAEPLSKELKTRMIAQLAIECSQPPIIVPDCLGQFLAANTCQHSYWMSDEVLHWIYCLVMAFTDVNLQAQPIVFPKYSGQPLKKYVLNKMLKKTTKQRKKLDLHFSVINFPIIEQLVLVEWDLDWMRYGQPGSIGAEKGKEITIDDLTKCMSLGGCTSD
jgi:hypothetical protein